MKKLLFILFACILTAGANAQLAGTKWQFTIKINDNDVATICSFAKDTLTVTAEGDGSLIEKMTLSVKGDVFTIKKVEGQSDCEEGLGSYKFEIKGNEMLLTLVSDDCSGRAEVLDKARMVKS